VWPCSPRRELTVDAFGFVLDYPDLWRVEARQADASSDAAGSALFF
jgi:hypothetical protein